MSDEQYDGPVAAAAEAAPTPTLEDVRRVAPALARYTENTLLRGAWTRRGLSPRDRSLVTVAALIARGQTTEMPRYFDMALDNGLKPAELSEVITHLAFYSGWANAMAAVTIAKDVFARRGIGADQLPPGSGERLPLDEAAEAQRAARVAEDVGAVAPGAVQYTSDPLFRDLWLRPALAPRDRSLVTLTALVAIGQVAPIGYHLNRAMDNGLTAAECSSSRAKAAWRSRSCIETRRQGRPVGRCSTRRADRRPRSADSRSTPALTPSRITSRAHWCGASSARI